MSRLGVNLLLTSCSALSRSRPIYTICTRNYAAKPPKKVTRQARKPRYSSEKPIKDDDVIWDDDPTRDEQMQQFFPEKYGELEAEAEPEPERERKSERERERPTRVSAKEKKAAKKRVVEDYDDDEVDTADAFEASSFDRKRPTKTTNTNTSTKKLTTKEKEQQKEEEEEEEEEEEDDDGDMEVGVEDLEGDDPMTRIWNRLGSDDYAPKNEMKVFYKEVVQQTTDKGSDMKYIKSMLSKNDKPGEQGWKEWKDETEIAKEQEKEEENEDEEDDTKPAKKDTASTKKMKEKGLMSEESKVRKNPEDFDRLYVGKTRIPEHLDQYFEPTEEEEAEKEIDNKQLQKQQLANEKKKKRFHEQGQQPKVRQLRIAREIRDIVENVIHDQVTMHESDKLNTTFSELVISKVEPTRDLRYADIYWYTEDPRKRKQYEKLLSSMKGFLRKQIASRMAIKWVPEVRVMYDEADDYYNHMEKLIAREHKRVFGTNAPPVKFISS